MNEAHLLPLSPRYYSPTTSGDLESLALAHPEPDMNWLKTYIASGAPVDFTSTPFRHIKRERPQQPVLPKVASIDPVSAFESALERAVSRQIGDERQCVVSLSGGLDSAAMALMATRTLGPSNVRAFTIGYEWRARDPEPAAAKETATALGIDWQFIPCDQDEIGWPAAPPHLTGPMLSAPRSSALAKEFVGTDLLVSGMGGDPLFTAGRAPHADNLRERGPWHALKGLAVSFRANPRAPGLGIRRLFSTAQDATPLASMFAPLWAALFEDADFERTYGSIRVTYPFFDRDVVALIESLPAAPWRTNKWILRETLRPYLPKTIVNRPKTLAVGATHLFSPQAKQHLLQSLASHPIGASHNATASQIPPGQTEWYAYDKLLRRAAVANWLNFLESST